MGQRMSAQKMLCFKQSDQGSQSGLMDKVLFSRCVLLEPSPPILLPLTTQSRKPTTQGNLLEQTQKNREPDRLKPPIIELRSQGMDRSTIRTAISPQTQRFGRLVEIPPYIPMTPQPRTLTPRTPRRTRPRIALPDFLQELDIEIAIQYQGRSVSGDN